MNTKVKIGIASVIVAALVTLIVIDQRAKKPASKEKATASTPRLFPRREAPRETPATTPDRNVVFTGQNNVQEVINRTGETAIPTPRPAPEVTPRVETAVVAAATEYTIQAGDTPESISEKHYGVRSLFPLIMNANPGLKATALRINAKIKIPAKPEAASEEASVAVESVGGRRTYTVRPGDTLGAISKKFFNTTRYAEAIFEANRTVLSSPDELQVDMKIVLPEITPRKAEAQVTSPVVEERSSDAMAAGGRIYKIASGDKLWNIADKYRGDKGILEMIDHIVKANPEKFKSGANTPLRIDWTLVIPD